MDDADNWLEQLDWITDCRECGALVMTSEDQEVLTCDAHVSTSPSFDP